MVTNECFIEYCESYRLLWQESYCYISSSIHRFVFGFLASRVKKEARVNESHILTRTSVIQLQYDLKKAVNALSMSSHKVITVCTSSISNINIYTNTMVIH